MIYMCTIQFLCSKSIFQITVMCKEEHQCFCSVVLSNDIQQFLGGWGFAAVFCKQVLFSTFENDNKAARLIGKRAQSSTCFVYQLSLEEAFGITLKLIEPNYAALKKRDLNHKQMTSDRRKGLMAFKSLGGLAAAREGAGGGKWVHSRASSVRDLPVHPIEMMGYTEWLLFSKGYEWSLL